MVVTEVAVVALSLTDVLDEPLQVTIRIGDLLCGRLDVRGQVGVARGPSPLRPGQKRLGVLRVVFDPMGQEHLELRHQLVTRDRVYFVMIVMMMRVRVARVVMMMHLVRRRRFLQGRRCPTGQALRLLVDQNHAPATFWARQRRLLSTSTLKTHRALQMVF